MTSKPATQWLMPWIALPSVLDVLVHDLRLDSRQVQSGDAFICMSRDAVVADAHVADAIRRGAVLVVLASEVAGWDELRGALRVRLPLDLHRLGLLVARFYGEPAQRLAVIGVTGTNGKTSVTRFVAQLMSASGMTCGTLGTLGYGLPGREVPASHTTPDVVSVHRWLANMARQGAKAVAMEVSSHALTQGRVEGVHFDVAVFTNLTRDHLDYHGSMEAYGEAKRALFDAHRPRYAVINVDDPFGVQLSARLAGEMQVVRTSLQASEAELFVQRLECTAEGLLMACAGRWGAFELNVPLMGRFNAMNVLQAVASVLVCEIPLDVVVQAVRQLQAPPGRLQQFIFPQGLRVVVDYAHTPDALANALGALRAHCHGRLRCVFGCGGDRDAGKRPEMGRVAAEMADDVILTDDNPRSEMPENIVAQILTGIASPDLIRVQHDREQAIRDALRDAGPDDIVLIAGKGHEDYQEVAGVRRPFSDIAVVQTCLQELSA